MIDVRRVSFVIVTIHIVWIGVSLALFGAGKTWLFDGFLAGGLVAPLIFFHIFLASLATAFFMVYAMEPLRARHCLRVGFIGVSLLLTAVIYVLSSRLDADDHGYLHFLKMLNTANLIIFANLLGSWITVPLRRPAELVPLCVVMVLADLFSVFKGPSREVIESLTFYYETGMVGPPPAADFLLFKITVPGIEQLIPVFGVSDWIIISFFSAATVKFRFNDNLAGKSIVEMMSERRVAFYFPISVLGLFIAVQAAHVLDIFLPALPLVVIFFMFYTVIRYPDARRLDRSDWLATVGAVFVMSGLMVIYGRLF